MADGGNFDPCECICSTEWAMRRLLSLLRTTQDYCTDTECLNEPPTGPPQQDTGMFFMVVLWLFVLVALFFSRPSSMRRSIGPYKSANNDRDGSNRPPDVPPIQ